MNTSAWPLYPPAFLERLYAVAEPDAHQLAREMERSIRFQKLASSLVAETRTGMDGADGKRRAR